MTDTAHVFRSDLPGWVYVVEGELTGLMKIGIAAEPHLRMRSLQGGSPDRIRVLALFHEAKAGWAERDLHRRFDHARSHGEWFKPSDRMRAWAIDSCKADPDFKAYVQKALDNVWNRKRRCD